VTRVEADSPAVDVARQVTRGGAARAASYAVGSLITAIGSVFLLRHLGLVEFGRYGTVMALLAIVSGVTEGGLSTTATRDMSLLQSGTDRRRLLRDLVALRIALSTAGVAAAVGFALLAGYDSTMVAGTLVAGVGVLLVSVQAALLVPLIVDLRNGRVAVNEVVRQSLLVVGIVGLVLAGTGLGPFFTNQLAVGVVLLALTPLVVGRGSLVLPRFDWGPMWRLLRAAAPLAVATVLGTIYFRILVVIASVLTDDVETARFVTSSRIFELLIGLPLLMTGVVLPVMAVAARDDPGRLRYVTQRLTEVAALSGGLICLVLVLGARPILVLLGGDQYGTVADVLRLQSPMILTLFLVAAWSPVLIALHRQRALVVTTSLGLTTAVVGGLVLIPIFQAEGAAAAAVLAELVNAGAAYVALRRLGPGTELHFGWIPRALLAGGAGLAAGLACPGPDAVATAVGAAVYVGAALALRLVPPEVLQALRRHRPGPA
jgi:O-antigen/teichoic acid export membrane protein